MLRTVPEYLPASAVSGFQPQAFPPGRMGGSEPQSRNLFLDCSLACDCGIGNLQGAGQGKFVVVRKLRKLRLSQEAYPTDCGLYVLAEATILLLGIP